MILCITGSYFKVDDFVKHFWKATGKIFRNLVVAKVFGFVLSATILLALSDVIGSVITQIFSVLLVVVLLFTTAWEQGSKDANLIAIGQMDKKPWFGVTTALVASSVEFVAAILLLLTKAGVVGEAYTRFYGIFNSNYVAFHQALLPNTLTVAEHDWGNYFLVASTVLIAPLCAFFGYQMGRLQVSIADTLLYTTPEARKRHEQKMKNKYGSRKHRRFFR